MTDTIGWIGQHTNSDQPAPGRGMLSGISLTLARGFDSDDEFLISLGADLDELAARTPYQDRGPLPADHHPAMYGTHGDWLYVLENWGRATWYTGYTGGVKSMRPYPDEEIICITLNEFSPPRMIVHAPGDGNAYRAEFTTDTGQGSALDTALQAAGAVLGPRPEDDADIPAYEDRLVNIAGPVFAAVGTYTGVLIDQTAVTTGTLPYVALPAV
ncbi:hypothetical protein OHO83_03895 [Streptomyces sp. NBC_00569]|uniref:hypothetical protein n=1 Tax=Streptomyces sp. NBC_00569 TaxID=2975780 RepID=UPI002E7FBCBF|nr:hypothetical protein [Streptomyces sp. NBC_00569]WUB91532.1 hypothetical protein OHO83_03895 [Streptomyces sp. NBC_00569]